MFNIKYNHYVLGCGNTLESLERYSDSINLKWLLRTTYFSDLGVARDYCDVIGRTDQRAFTEADVTKVCVR